jgi:hypothetical protein
MVINISMMMVRPASYQDQGVWIESTMTHQDKNGSKTARNR